MLYFIRSKRIPSWICKNCQNQGQNKWCIKQISVLMLHIFSYKYILYVEHTSLELLVYHEFCALGFLYNFLRIQRKTWAVAWYVTSVWYLEDTLSPRTLNCFIYKCLLLEIRYYLNSVYICVPYIYPYTIKNSE